MLRRLVTTENTSGNVWADSAYRSRKNEKWLSPKMLRSQIHRRKPTGKPMPPATARANAKKSSVRARVEHVFVHQKYPSWSSGMWHPFPAVSDQGVSNDQQLAHDGCDRDFRGLSGLTERLV